MPGYPTARILKNQLKFHCVDDLIAGFAKSEPNITLEDVPNAGKVIRVKLTKVVAWHLSGRCVLYDPELCCYFYELVAHDVSKTTSILIPIYRGIGLSSLILALSPRKLFVPCHEMP